jgi:type II secretory pathway pseudopilin PulG
MYLEGQGNQRGYAMAALLVTLGVMAVLMSAAMPVWRHEAQREREMETIFRGQQIARAIAMYREKNGGSFPSSLDVLVKGRFLRKDYKDLLTADGKWQEISGTSAPPPAGPGRGAQPQPQTPQPPGQPGQPAGIMGVSSKDRGPAIVEYNRATHHNEYQFMFSQAKSRLGASQGGRGAGPGGQAPGRGARPGGPGTGVGPGIGGPGGTGRGPGRGAGPFGGPGAGRRGGGD